MAKTRWGIISTGGIANFFAEGLTHVEDAELVAVGSRTQASADAFGDKWNVPHRYDSYQALVDDPDVDAVYIGTPHNYHRDNAIMAIEAGKAVLCEKPFAVNYKEALAMVELARAKGVFLMEAMWTRFLPAYVRIRELLAAGAIGEVRMVQADFCFDADYDPKHRLFNPDLAGGALLDVGIYPIAFAYMVLGEPQQVTGTAIKAPTGVDEHSCYMFQYEGGVTAMLSSSVATRAPIEAKIIGTKGYIKVPQPFFNARSFVLARHGGESEFIYEGKIFDEELIEVPTVGVGYNYEAAAVGQYLRDGKTESDIIPLDETLSMMKTMDTLRAQWGLRYPFEV